MTFVMLFFLGFQINASVPETTTKAILSRMNCEAALHPDFSLNTSDEFIVGASGIFRPRTGKLEDPTKQAKYDEVVSLLQKKLTTTSLHFVTSTFEGKIENSLATQIDHHALLKWETDSVHLKNLKFEFVGDSYNRKGRYISALLPTLSINGVIFNNVRILLEQNLMPQHQIHQEWRVEVETADIKIQLGFLTPVSVQHSKFSVLNGKLNVWRRSITPDGSEKGAAIVSTEDFPL